jgi:hypothetical protein
MQDSLHAAFLLCAKERTIMMNMHTYYVAVGDRENWNSAFTKGNIGGLSEGRRGIYRKISVGDHVFCYVEKPVMGVVGLARVIRKFRD